MGAAHAVGLVQGKPPHEITLSPTFPSSCRGATEGTDESVLQSTGQPAGSATRLLGPWAARGRMGRGEGTA